MTISNVVKRILLTVVFSILSIPVLVFIIRWIVIPSDYDYDGSTKFGYGFFIFLFILPPVWIATAFTFWFWVKKKIKVYDLDYGSRKALPLDPWVVRLDFQLRRYKRLYQESDGSTVGQRVIRRLCLRIPEFRACGSFSKCVAISDFAKSPTVQPSDNKTTAYGTGWFFLLKKFIKK